MKTLVFFLLTSLLASLAGAEEQGPAPPGGQERLQHIERQLTAAGMTGDEAGKMVATMTAARLSIEQMETLAQHLVADSPPARAAAADKIREGKAKGAPPEAIVMAVERVRTRLEQATRLAASLHLADDDALVEAIAESLAAGLRTEHATRLAAALNSTATAKMVNRELAEQTALFARDMARRRVLSDTVIDVLEQTLSRNPSPSDMSYLRSSFNASSGNAEQQARRAAGATGGQAQSAEKEGVGKSASASGQGEGQGGSTSGGAGAGGAGGGAGGGEGGGGGGGGPR